MNNLEIKNPQNEDANSVQRLDPKSILSEGSWVMVSDHKNVWNEERKQEDLVPYEWFACVMAIGSNYVEVRHPESPQGGYTHDRIHLDEIWERLRLLSNDEADQIIRSQILHYQDRSTSLMREVNSTMARLGLRTSKALSGPAKEVGTALAVLSEQHDVSSYKQDLILAQEKTLPNLFGEIKLANEELARWSLASTLPMKVMVGDLNAHVDQIKTRIYNISLYAGLSEQLVCCSEGKPAKEDEKLRVMQRRCYMDEECLANYEGGGMNFDGIENFDAWISRPENRDRILPFPRTVVAMRVRRNKAELDFDGSLLSAFVNMQIHEGNSMTFLYIRNGEQVWRLSTEIDFGETIFPDKKIYDPSESMMVKMFGTKIDKMMTRREFDQIIEDQAKWHADNPLDEWKLKNPGKDSYWWKKDFPNRYFEAREWKPLDSSNVYFDDALKSIGDEVAKYNRIATVIQGVFDRSEALHPHPPVKTWTSDGFDRAIELVYDANAVLHHGEAPDFDAYRQRCNESIREGSMVTGQKDAWLRKEGEKENERRRIDYRLSDSERNRELKKFKPYGNPGPKIVARVDAWKPRTKEATFRWSRERRSYPFDEIPCSISVAEKDLFNVSAYTPGDFKQFFQDSRTRAIYLKWAPMLLEAEDWHARKSSVE